MGYAYSFCVSIYLISLALVTGAAPLSYILVDLKPDDELLCQMNAPVFVVGIKALSAEIQRDIRAGVSVEALQRKVFREQGS